MTNVATTATVGFRSTAWFERMARFLVLKSLESLQYGSLTIIDQGQKISFGKGSEGEPKAMISIVNPRAWDRIAFGGTVGAAESYMDADWSTDDLVAVVQVMCGNRDVMNGLEGGLALLKWPVLKLYHSMRRDTIAGARKNISAHYDLGNDFFAAWLDSSMTYSSGIFPSKDATMLSASLTKIQTLCDKLKLKATDHLLEIGSGWGSTAFFAAANYGCRVTTVTISKNQFNFVRDEVKRLRLDDKIEVLFSDYRKIEGQFDKIVSVEMIEAVGHNYLDLFFQKVSKLLKPDGIAAIQAITIRDQFYDNAVRNVDFIQRYIFPGSTIPSVARMMDAVRDATDLKLESLEDYTPHYAMTIHNWRKNFWKAEPKLRTMGCKDSMLRMWDFYFAYCEGGFREEVIGVAHLLLAKPRHRSTVCPMQ